MDNNGNDNKNNGKGTRSVNDSRLDEIKQNMGYKAGAGDDEAGSIIDGQVGFDDFMAKVEQTSEIESSGDLSIEQKAELKKKIKQEMLVTAGLGKNILQKSVDVVMHESMMPYSEHVILDRALPRVEDGLKPVQRRILYTMLELGITPDKPFRKSARIVGDCLGKYHPHGDTSVYDAMVRMAQSFNMGRILVDGHGNFGSDDGDGAAAMRYTEARLAPLAMEMLRDLEKDTVHWSFNFDDTLKEPDMLPSRYPNLLVNGATGIAVGLATNIPTHNLNEVISGVVAYIDNPKITLKEMMKHIKGPDFPTGGYVVGGEELVNAYETGRGKVTLRAKAYIETGDRDRKSIVITEFPYGVKKASLLSKLLDLRETKKEQLEGIAEILDESDRNGTRAVIRVKKDVKPEKLLENLYKYSELQVNFGINMVVIADGRPQQLGLLPIIKYYVDYQQQIIYRRTKYELDQAKERAHILEGLVIAVRNIDEVVKIIKTSANTSEAKKRLMERFVLSERQAQAILDLRLARLTSLEVFKLEQELADLKILIDKLTKILNSPKLQLETVKSELLEIRKRFKTERRSIILSSLDEYELPTAESLQTVENVVIGITKDGAIKSHNSKYFASATKEFSERTASCEIYKKLLPTATNKTLMFFSNLGNAFKISAGDIPEMKWKDKGLAFAKMFKEVMVGEYPVAVFEMPEQEDENALKQNLIFFSKLGMIKKTAWSEYFLLKNYFQATKFKDDDYLVDVVPENLDPKGTILFVTKNGMALNAFTDDIPLQGRISGGVKGIMLSDGDEVVLSEQVMPNYRIAVITNKGYAKKVKLAEIEPMARYRKGVKIMDLTATNNGNEVVFASTIDKPYTIAIEDIDGNKAGYSTDSLDNQNRTTSGKSLVRAKTGIDVKSVDIFLNWV